MFDFCVSLALFYFVTKNIITSALASLALTISAYAFRVYETESLESLNEQFVRLLVSSVFSVTFLLFLKLLENSVTPGKEILKGYLATYVSLPLLNTAVYYLQTTRFTKPKKYLVIGKREEVKHLLDEIFEKSRGRYIFAECINPAPTVLKEKLKKFDYILIADFELYKSVQHVFEPYRYTKKVEFLSNLAEKILRRIPLEVIDKFREYYEIQFENARESPAKRVLDVFGAIVGFIVFSPAILISAVAILIEDGKPVIFKQLRVGKDNKEFMLVKLRSMKKQTDGQARFADQEMDRILKIGRIIRSMRIDETLQFWNILKGDMSLVGPRPEQIPFVREFEQKIPYYSYRHKLKPGLTGWAQIMYQYSSTLEEVKRKLEYDLYYIKNRSTLLDLRIILQTIEVVFWGRGAR